MKLRFNIGNTKNTRPLILVSNDDGINAKGINELVDAIKTLGNIVVVAPDKGNSAKSHAVTMTEPLILKKIQRDDGVKSFSCSGTPADSVKIAIHEILDRKPDLLISGINHGSNASISVVYSGTFAAALEGKLNGVPSIAFSLLNYDSDADFALAKKYAKSIVKKILKNGLDKDICLNVNIPDIPVKEAKGVKICRQTTGSWQEKFEKRKHPHGSNYYWLTGEFHNYEPDAEDTDEWALQNNYVAIVPIKLDWTDYEQIDELKKWNLK